MTRPSFAILAAALFIAVTGTNEAHAAPVTFNTALPIAEGEFLFRGQFLFMKASGDPSPADRDMDVTGGVAVAGYGVTRDLALFGVLPYLDKRIEMAGPLGGRISRSTQGLGDTQIFARYTIFQKDFHGRNFRIAPFAGIELPTGDDNGRDSFGRLPPALQLGAGSWNPFGGAIATYQTLDYEIDTQLGYKANTEVNSFRHGDEFRFDMSMQYRVWPRELGTGVPGFLYGVVEANLLHRTKDEIGGIDDPNSGGTELYLSPGLQYVTRRWVLEAVAQVPVIQDLNGSALKEDYTVEAGFRMNF